MAKSYVTLGIKLGDIGKARIMPDHANMASVIIGLRI